MQARVRFVPVAGNPLRRSCVLDARNAGESAIWFCPAQPSAEIVRVGCAKCRRECDLVVSGATFAEIVRVKGAKRRRECVLDLAWATLCTDRACRGREMQARVRFGPVRRNPLRRLRVDFVVHATLVRGAICGAGS